MATIDVEKVLSELNMLEKITMLAGKDFWHTVDVPRLGVPSLRFSDGPNGVRGITFLNSYPSSCFPCATGVAAAFDVGLARELGVAMGEESIAKGVHVWLGPTMNIQRSPLGGRGFESFSEDPFVQGLVGSALIEGIQSKGVAATMKHYVGNEAEKSRQSCDSVIDPVALREVYLKPFEMCVAGPSPPWAAMTAYNRVNGVHVSENREIIKDILRDEWKWDGLLMSDWTGTYSTIEALEAGLDLEMPGPSTMRGQALLRCLGAGKLDPQHIDNAVRNILNLVKRAQGFGHKFDAPEAAIDTPERRALLRKAVSSSIVVLKNDGILPVGDHGKPKSIAIIGPNSKSPSIHGGGSAMLKATYRSAPFEAIVEAAGAAGIAASEVKYAKGCSTHLLTPPLFDVITDPVEGKKGYYNVSFFSEDPRVSKNAKPIHSFRGNDEQMFLFDGIPDTVPIKCWAVAEASLEPDESGEWEFGTCAAGQTQVFIDGKLIVDNETEQQAGSTFLGFGSTEIKNTVTLQAGKKYNLQCVFSNQKLIPGHMASPGRGALRFGGSIKTPAEEARRAAVELAKQQELVIIVAGLNGDWESEGWDRANLKLPPGTDELIEAVCDANPNTVVVMQSGMPVEMPWVARPKAIVQAWFGGNETGNGLADVLFGKVEPSGRLPLTFPLRNEDTPTFLGFPETYHVGLYGKVVYNEGVNVGYKFYDATQRQVLFPFGAGLSYTTFEWSDAKASLSGRAADGTGKIRASVTVKNTGKRAGKEVVQLYVREPGSLVKELKGFSISPKNIPAGSHETIEVVIDVTDLGKWDVSKNGWKVAKGKKTIELGASSRDIRATLEIEIEKDVTWTGIKKRTA